MVDHKKYQLLPHIRTISIGKAKCFIKYRKIHRFVVRDLRDIRYMKENISLNETPSSVKKHWTHTFMLFFQLINVFQGIIGIDPRYHA